MKEIIELFIMSGDCYNMIMRGGKCCCDIVRNELRYDKVTTNMHASQYAKNGWLELKLVDKLNGQNNNEHC